MFFFAWKNQIWKLKVKYKNLDITFLKKSIFILYAFNFLQKESVKQKKLSFSYPWMFSNNTLEAIGYE